MEVSLWQERRKYLPFTPRHIGIAVQIHIRTLLTQKCTSHRGADAGHSCSSPVPQQAIHLPRVLMIKSFSVRPLSVIDALH
jgi:hypothetical protein